MNFELKILRKKAKISQFKLAREAGISRYRVSLAECGYATLREEEAQRVKKVLEKLLSGKKARRG